ncbi:MAG: hypothetical protein K8F25_15105, partial [Fimbriimonadaceae bacterium]|nr:hypothetical protein [Alphaproteobacteria bacterium]
LNHPLADAFPRLARAIAHKTDLRADQALHLIEGAHSDRDLIEAQKRKQNQTDDRAQALAHLSKFNDPLFDDSSFEAGTVH